MSVWSNNVAATLQTVESSLEDANNLVQNITWNSKGESGEIKGTVQKRHIKFYTRTVIFFLWYRDLHA
jgi:hypothetical protein